MWEDTRRLDRYRRGAALVLPYRLHGRTPAPADRRVARHPWAQPNERTVTQTALAHFFSFGAYVNGGDVALLDIPSRPPNATNAEPENAEQMHPWPTPKNPATPGFFEQMQKCSLQFTREQTPSRIRNVCS